MRRLSRVVERQGKLLKIRFDQKCDKLQSTVEENSKKDAIQDRHLKSHLDAAIRVQSDKVQSQLGQRIDEVNSNLDQRISNIDQKLERVLAALEGQ